MMDNKDYKQMYSSPSPLKGPPQELELSCINESLSSGDENMDNDSAIGSNVYKLMENRSRVVSMAKAGSRG